MVWLWLVLELTSSPTPCDQLASLHWLAGSWSTDKIEEVWFVPRRCSLVGLNRTLTAKGVHYETMVIDVRENRIQLTAHFLDGRAVSFPASKWSARSVTFHNPQHDFPTTIRYWRDGTQLCAAIPMCQYR